MNYSKFNHNQKHLPIKHNFYTVIDTKFEKVISIRRCSIREKNKTSDVLKHLRLIESFKFVIQLISYFVPYLRLSIASLFISYIAEPIKWLIASALNFPFVRVENFSEAIF